MLALGRREGLNAKGVSGIGPFLPVARSLRGGPGVPCKDRKPRGGLPRESLAQGKLLRNLERDWKAALLEADEDRGAEGRQYQCQAETGPVMEGRAALSVAVPWSLLAVLPGPDRQLSRHRRDLLLIFMLTLGVPHQRLALLELSVVLGHEGGIDAAISSSHHHHDTDNAAHDPRDDHCADGSPNAHGPVPLLLRAGSAGLRLRLGPRLGFRRLRAGLGAGRAWSIQPGRVVLVLQLGTVVKHLHWDRTHVLPP